MSARLEAVPTEYKGVVYRSKCEAMFARWIELEMIGVRNYDHFEYEPKYLEVEGWVPDFCVLQFLKKHLSFSDDYPDFFPRVDFQLIEYKPSKPTKSYLKQFGHRCETLMESLVLQHGSSMRYRLDFSLYYGSLWTEKSDVITVVQMTEDKWFFNEEEFDWLALHADAIRKTRFDLEVNHAT